MLRIRHARMTDAKILFKWRNDPEIYKYFRNPKPVEWESHERWLGHAIAKADDIEIFIITFGKRRIGSIRYEYSDGAPGGYIISVIIGKKYWGKGYARQAIEILAKRVSTYWPQSEVFAVIHKENLGSIKAFEAGGFKKGYLYSYKGDGSDIGDFYKFSYK